VMARRLVVGVGGRVRVVPGRTECAGCGGPIVWRLTKLRRYQPMNPDGTSHFSTCPKAEAFRRVERRRSVAMLAGRLGGQERLF